MTEEKGELPSSGGEARETPSQLDFSIKDYAGPKYKFTRLVPLSGFQTVTIPTNTTVEVLIEIPTVVFNGHESFLSGTLSLPIEGAAIMTWLYADTISMIQSLDFYTRSGVYICQIPYVPQYTKVCRKLHTCREEFGNNDISSLLAPSRSLNNAPPGIPPTVTTVGFQPASRNWDDTAYTLNTTTNMGYPVNTGPATFNFRIPMHAFKDSIWAMDKDIVFPEVMVMRIVFGPAQRMGWGGTSATDPTIAPTALANPITINNLNLYLAVEKNDTLAGIVRNAVNTTGVKLLIPYVYVYKNSLAATNQNISLRFNRGHGKNLLSVITAPFATASYILNTTYDNSNVISSVSAGAQNPTGGQPTKVQYYQTYLDQIPMQVSQVNCGNYMFSGAANNGGIAGDDYRENAKYLKDTPFLDQAVYNQNWFHQDKFYEDSKSSVPGTNLDKGMSLILERKYDFMANMVTNATTYDWYTFAICQKELHIGKDMIAYT
jgi:hypothetical protein